MIKTSWDDGHPSDLRLACLLEKYHIPAIFYIPIQNKNGLSVLNSSQIQRLSQTFEIGAHTQNHIDLTTISLDEAKREILQGKINLENIIGKEVTQFCFPMGRFNDRLIQLVQSCGFTTARSARLFNTNPYFKTDFLEHPNLHIFPHPKWIDMAHCIKHQDLQSLNLRLRYFGHSHLDFAALLCSHLSQIHLWGHSWELDQYDLWGVLETFFREISQ